MTVRTKIRLYDLAKELKLDTKRLIQEVRRHGVDVSVPSNSVRWQLANTLREKYLPKYSVKGKLTPKLTHRTFIGPLPEAQGSKESSTDKGGPKLFHKPFVGLLNETLSSDKAPRPDNTHQTIKSPIVARRTIRGKKSVNRSKQKQGLRGRKLMLMYTPPPAISTSKSSHKKSPHKKERICAICSEGLASKALLRQHVIARHMKEIVEGKARTRATAYELSQAIRSNTQEVMRIANRMGTNLKNGSEYIPAPVVKHVVVEIQNAATRNIPQHSNESVSTTEVLRSTTKLSSDLFETLVRVEFGELREIIDDCLHGREVRRGNETFVSYDPAVLLEYARLLESKARGSSPSSFHRRIVNRVF